MREGKRRETVWREKKQSVDEQQPKHDPLELQDTNFYFCFGVLKAPHLCVASGEKPHLRGAAWESGAWTFSAALTCFGKSGRQGK